MKIKIKIITSLLCTVFSLQQAVFAGPVYVEPGIAVPAATTLPAERFRPLHLRSVSGGLPGGGLRLLLDKGDAPWLGEQEIENVAKKLLGYFFVGLALPDDSFWVNLRPDSPRDIIDPLLAQTEVGRILLEADLQLKRDAARATDPRTPAGREYWNRLYEKAAELYGSRDVVIPALTRPWIVPDEIIIHGSGDSAYVFKATLKVMLEQDRLKGNAVYSFSDPRERELNEYASRLIRETVIPGLTRAVNVSRRYASLRQVYYSLILASWFKSHGMGLKLKKDFAQLKALTPCRVADYFNAYKTSFTEGEYDIKESVTGTRGPVIRRYISGGVYFGTAGGITGAVRRGLVNAAFPADIFSTNPNNLPAYADGSGNNIRLMPSQAVAAREGGVPSYRDQVEAIRGLLATVDGRKVKRISIKEGLVSLLMSITREGTTLFKRPYAERIARLRELGARLSLIEYLLLLQAGDGKNKYVFNDSHIAAIAQSSRGEKEIKGLIKSLQELGITEGAHLSQILQSSRSEMEIRMVIDTLRELGITENPHVAVILHSSRGHEEIRKLVAVLRELGMRESQHISMVLHTQRTEEEIRELTAALRARGITDNYHISLILRSSRKKADIESAIDALKSLGITQGAHVAPILQSSRSAQEITSLVKVLNGMGITEGSHAALIVRSARSEAEVIRLTGILRGAGMAENYHIAAVLHSARGEAEIISLIAALKGLGITEPAHISVILATSRKEAEIKRLAATMKELGMGDAYSLTLVLRTSRKEAEVRELVTALRSLGFRGKASISAVLYSSRPKDDAVNLAITLRHLGITQESHLAMIMQSSRKETEIQSLIESLRASGIRDGYHLALSIYSSRSAREITRVIAALKELGITESSHVAAILHTSRKETELKTLVGILREAGISASAHIAMTLQGSRGPQELAGLIAALKSEGISEGSHLSLILSTARGEAEIISLIAVLKGLGITEPYHIALILRSGRQEAGIKEVIGLLREAGIKSDFHIAKILATSRAADGIRESVRILQGLGITEGYYISLILHSSRTEAEIKKLENLKDIIMKSRGKEYPEGFVRDMLIGFAFMDDPVPLMNRILATDFALVKLEIEQMPLNTTRNEFIRRYGEMSVWILKYFGKDFRFLSSFIRGYAVGYLLPDPLESVENMLPAPDNIEEQVEQLFLRELLQKAISRLGSAEEQEVVRMYLEGCAEDEIVRHYPNVPLADVFARLKQVILKDAGLREDFSEYVGVEPRRDGGKVKEEGIPGNFLGGIDLRTLSAGAHRSADMAAVETGIIDVRAELARFRDMLSAGLVPSGKRVKDCARALLRENGRDSVAGEMLNCIADIFRLQEERGMAASGELISVLTLFDPAG